MPSTRPRPSSPSPAPSPKRQKLARPSSTTDEEHTSAFVPGLFDPPTVAGLAQAYEASEPYKHAVLPALVDDALLREVKDEILNELRFAEKETDIYKVHQTGDLASLNYLTPAQLALFPSLLRLRNALYSRPFRQFMRSVTGCGPLSGTKQDMSANSYRAGCHLLNHDDVIGTRRVSYILYLPLAGGGEVGWQDAWGGALELYPVSSPAAGELPEPAAVPTKRLPPSWNQFVFFEVQPGHSFHSVEEVVVPLHPNDSVGGSGEGRQRLSISGWFHMAQPGEEGYEESRAQDRTERLQSSLEQLSASEPAALTPYPNPAPFLPSTPLTEAELLFLSTYLNPVYLQPRSLLLLADQFAADSSLNLKDFLCSPLAQKLEPALRGRDAADGLGPERAGHIPPHSAGVGHGWQLSGPPHKLRYCVLSPSSSAQNDPAAALLQDLQETLLPSPAFRAWLGLVTSLVPLSHQARARRFRPGLDYTLAQAEEGEARLDVVICVTPQPAEGEEVGKAEGGWASCAWGGWECYMAPHEGEEDPAVYRSGGKVNGHANGNGKEEVNGSGSGGANGNEADREAETADSDDSEEDETGTLLTAPASFNGLLIVLRDPKLMRFVKYVSAAAEGSRWDVCGEWQVGDLQVDEGDDE
ncbi:hypothetical protein CALVIDRAFT_479244 [Calocera viscosa TUFC12733]|uniref:uS12 prolyl 3,4-dihydroxylase n=1 Tax=Calocera viscosa (strain TUFC12733) TaxID=1330018 RepID=A0A167NW30_CALVF|nr:hypothetical protein CALVIDRAFT_479244 [Calocera viscosa TUFC12733]